MNDIERRAIEEMTKEAEKTGADKLLRMKPLEWIPCSHQLPEDGETVIAGTCSQLFLCYFDSVDGFICNGEPVEVGVWLPADALPELPKPEMLQTEQNAFSCVYECQRYDRNRTDGLRILCCVGRDQKGGEVR